MIAKHGAWVSLISTASYQLTIIIVVVTIIAVVVTIFVVVLEEHLDSKNSTFHNLTSKGLIFFYT